MEKTGWIKLHRKFLKWEWYQKSEMVHLFLHLLLSANSEDGRWQGIEVKRGQLVTGRKSLFRDTSIPEQTLRTCLERLKDSNEITVKSTNKFSIITLVKYNDYQKREKNQPTTNQQLTTNKNIRSKEEISFSKNSKDLSIKKQTTSMKPYEEKSIDYETGEIAPSKPKEKKNEMAFALIKYFNSQCVKHLGTKPVEMKGSYFVVLKAVKNLTKPQITELVAEWFASGKENKDLIQITRCFSANNINIYKANHGIL